MGETEVQKDFYFEILKEKTEWVAGCKMCTPRDFDFLAKSIYNETKKMLSPTTLKRFWGYLRETENQRPSQTTLNVLSQFVGYIDFETFCKYQQQNGECSSDFLRNNTLQTKSLCKGDKLKLMWEPDRCITIQYIGLCMFKILESKNSKLSVNDIFICERIVENTPLLLSNLIHENSDPLNYICGRNGGVKYFQIS